MAIFTSPPYITGSILWLPPKDEIPLAYHHELDRIGDGCFNHPALILFVNQTHTEVVILIITSFNKTDLQEKHPRNADLRRIYMPIHPSNSHPDNGSLLYLKGKNRLARNSYVNTKTQYTIRPALLRPTRRPMCKLRADSLMDLIKHTGFESPWADADFNDQFTSSRSLLHQYSVKPVPQLLPQVVDQPLCEPVTPPLPEILSQPSFDSVQQVLPESVRSPLFEPLYQPSPERLRSLLSEPVTQPVLKPITQAVLEPITQSVPEFIIQPVPVPAIERQPFSAPMYNTYGQSDAQYRDTPASVQSPFVANQYRPPYRPGDHTSALRQTYPPIDLPANEDSCCSCQHLAVGLVILVLGGLFLYYSMDYFV